MTFSKWVALIVPVMEGDGSTRIRICGDYKLTVNRGAKADVYPIPCIDEIFASVAGGKDFTKLDLSHAYKQLLLDQEFKKYTTINTHKGLFQYN